MSKTAKVREVNLCAKSVTCAEAYEVWRSACACPNVAMSYGAGHALTERCPSRWEWRVLKKWQAPTAEAKNAYARWFCCVHTPITAAQMSHGGELGDVYVREVQQAATRVSP